MTHSTMKQLFVKLVAVVTCLAAFSFSTKAGGDLYEVYLNEKLLFRQYMTQPLNLQQLSLTAANKNDQLIIRYSHCGETGINRRITIKDAKGTTLKTWQFANAKGADKGMVIPVKEILQLEKNNSGKQLTVYYAAQQLPKGQLLTSFQIKDKSTTYRTNGREEIPLYAGVLALLCGAVLSHEKS